MFDIEGFPTNETAKELLTFINSDWYQRSYVGKWIFEVIGESLEPIERLCEELPKQFFLDTATWGLCYFEQKYMLPIRTYMGYEERRNIIRRKIQKKGITMSPYNMELLLKEQMGIESEISDIHDSGSLGYTQGHPNLFKVTVWEHGTNMELDFAKVEKIIKQVNQSHTAFMVEHRQNFNRSGECFAGAVVSEFVNYEIKAREINRDVERTLYAGTSVLMDEMIFEEIGVGRSNY